MYDDLLSAPRVVDIQPQGVIAFIEAIASSVYELSHQQGGSLPYTVIREITENFIHAGFHECTVSILDSGNTLRFADQGPGISKKDLVLHPGVSSATSAMKEYIRGVGSGFPIVREYLTTSHGYMSIEDNADDGTIITLSLVPASTASLDASPFITTQPAFYSSSFEGVSAQNHALSQQNMSDTLIKTVSTPEIKKKPILSLTAREEQSLLLLREHGMLGPVDLADLIGVSAPTAFRLLQKLEQMEMVESTQLKKRILSNAGLAYIQNRFES